MLKMEQRYEPLRDIGSGNFAVARLVRDKNTKELLVIKYIERGNKIDEKVQREIMNHMSLTHPNIIQFREVILTPTHLGIVMEYAAGGELYHRIVTEGRFSEDEARYFFQQLISGVSYCHSVQICHRDLKLENTLLDGNAPPLLKICDFGYSKSGTLHSNPHSTVGTPPYIAPEVLMKNKYDGKMADVWSCGVALYIMLFGEYPFEDPSSPRNTRKIIGKILGVQYSIPEYVHISANCRLLLSQIFVADPSKRITIPEINRHPWFLKDLPTELVKVERNNNQNPMTSYGPTQSIEEITQIVQKARRPAKVTSHLALFGWHFEPAEQEDSESDIDPDGTETEAEVDNL